MDRASGVYKRNTKGVLIIIGFLLAAATNASSIHVINRLAYDSALREALANASERAFFEVEELSTNPEGAGGDTPNNLTDMQIERIEEVVKTVELPIGWHPDLIYEEIGGCPTSEQDSGQQNGSSVSLWKELFDKCIDLKDNAGNKISSPDNYFVPTALTTMLFVQGKWEFAFLLILGWFITGIAISMGASFWFDLLGKLINVRNTGAKPSPQSSEQENRSEEATS